MTLPSVLLIVLQLCSLQLTVVTMPTCPVPGNVVQNAHHLLRDLGGPFPDHCRQYNANISFPKSAFPASAATRPECRRALSVVYRFLEEAGQVFVDQEQTLKEDELNWDTVKLDHFQNLHDRLLENGSCLSSLDTADLFTSYFSNVTAVVKEQDSTACGWTLLRRDLLWVLKSALQKYHGCFSW